MAHNGYGQQYGRGPPPQQQQYYDDHYNYRGYDNERQNQMYNQRNQGHEEQREQRYNEQHHYSYDNQHEQYGSWHNDQYYEPNHQEQYNQRPQRDDQAFRQQRSYQYDERYRMNGPNRTPAQNPREQPTHRPGGGGRGVGGRPPAQNALRGDASWGNDNYNHQQTSNRPPKVQDRILPTSPESPKTAAWDNPFPTFPSKKKQPEPKKEDTNEPKKVDTVTSAPSQDIQRPSTSHNNRQRAPAPDVDLPRPHTSHSQRDFEPPQGSASIPPMPHRAGNPDPRSRPDFNGEPPHSANQFRPGPRPQQSFHHEQFNDNTLSRPAPPRRAMTGPNLGQPQDNYGDYYEYPGASGRNKPPYNDYQTEHQSRESEHRDYPSRNNRNEYGHVNAANDYNEHASQSPQRLYDTSANTARPDSDPTSKYRLPDDQWHLQRETADGRNRDINSYNGAPLAQMTSPSEATFDVNPKSLSEKDEDHLGPSKPQHGVAYRKPTYQTASLPDLNTQKQSKSLNNSNELASPLAQFSFDLDSRGPPPQSQRTPLSPNFHPHQYNSDQYQEHRKPLPPGIDRPNQYPQRDFGQTQEYQPKSPRSFPAPGPPPIRPGLAQPPPRNQPHGGDLPGDGYGRSSYDQSNYGPAYSQDSGYGQGPPSASQAMYQTDSLRQGFDQRIQPRPQFAPSQAPPRPMTASSTRPGPMPDYVSRSSAETYRPNGMQNPDSLPAHPVPFRPGLSQAAPPMSRPTPPPQQQPPPALQQRPPPQMHQRIPSAQPPPAPAEPPVTIAELNTLRNEYKNRPNDHALGLRFAKRLVEAATVLASENGKADPKQTAKNRERYILDAHKTVKRLCSSGYPDAMFYLADCYGQGLLGLEVDPKEAFTLYQSAAKLGHAGAAYRVAVCCELGAEDGGGTRRDPLKAVQWYKRAATLGDTPAMYKMGMIQLKGLLGQQKSPREAISWLKRAAERADAENPHALHELGLLYESAQSTDIILKDEQYALQLFQQAAELGYKYSQFRLGSAYEYGLLGLPIDPRMSIAWYSRAAKQGEHQSEFALSGWYLTGSGQSAAGEQALLQQSDTEAYLWARKAASSGLAKAEYAMGYYTEVGIGVASNIEEAKRWYYRAAAQNHPKARERLEDLKKGGQRMQKTRVSRSNVGKHNEGECTVM